MDKVYQNVSVTGLSILGISLNLSDILTIISIVNIVIIIILNVYDRLKDKKFTEKEKEETIKDIEILNDEIKKYKKGKEEE